MEAIKEFIKSICQEVGSWFGIEPLYAGIILAAIGLIVLVTVIVLIVKACKKSKKKKAKSASQSTYTNKPFVIKQAEEIEQPNEEVKAEPKKEEVVVEEAKEEVVESKKETQPKEEKPKQKKFTKVETEKVEKKSAPKKLNGKWIVEIKSEDEYVAKLLASNGEVMLSSEIYSTQAGAVSGISTIVKCVDTGKFVIYQDKNGNSYYKLKNAGNRLLCVGEIYKSEDQCLKAVETVKRIAKDSPVIEELVEGAKYIDYTPEQLDEEAVMKASKGKWKIEVNPLGRYSAKLYANNGQLMLATEEVAQKKSAQNAIESVKKNAREGNFIIDKDKFGRFYYKLRNAQKSVICIGEAYDSLESCENALESVRRFAINSNIV